MVVPLRMGWRDFLFMHWPIDRDVLVPLVPDPLEIDTHQGEAFLSVIAFRNVDLRPAGLPRWTGITLPELNVRTYVQYADRPGIYFFSLDAAGLGSVLGARVFHHLPYYYADITHTWEEGEVYFKSRRRHPGARSARFEARYGPTGDPFRAPERERTRFLFERYRFFTTDTRGRTRATEVDHEPWTVYPAHADVAIDNMLPATGIPFPNTEPIIQFSPGMDVHASTSTIV